MNDSQGTEELTVEQAIANLTHEDVSLRYYAAWWLGRFRVTSPKSVDALTNALKDTDDRTEAGGYPLRRNAARALGRLGDLRAVQPLTECLRCSDFYVREAAAQALEMLGDPACIPCLIDLLENNVDNALPASDQMGIEQPYESVLEALGSLNAQDAISQIEPFLEHPMERVQYSAARAMYQLTHDEYYGERLVQGLHHPDPRLRRAALSDLGSIGYAPAAPSITSAPIESSLKLIALKDILEQNLDQKDPTVSLSDHTVRVLDLMDGLL